MAIIYQDIPVLPVNISWEEWNGNMLHYYGEEPLPYVAEENWPEFARMMGSLTTFSAYGFPGPETYSDWRDWASAIITIVNGPTN
jgi:hypothetical protein